MSTFHESKRSGLRLVRIPRSETSLFECQVRISIHGEYGDQRGPEDRRLRGQARLDWFQEWDRLSIGPLFCVSFALVSVKGEPLPYPNLECRFIRGLSLVPVWRTVFQLEQVNPHLSVSSVNQLILLLLPLYYTCYIIAYNIS